MLSKMQTLLGMESSYYCEIPTVIALLKSLIIFNHGKVSEKMDQQKIPVGMKR